jgi:hypothetical protein
MAKQKTVKKRVTKQPKTISTKLIKYDVYNFRFDDVKKFCDTLTTPEKKILYLEYVKKEKMNHSEGLALEFYYQGPSFVEKIENEIDYIKTELKLKNKKTKQVETIDKIVWLKNRQDFVALFDVLMNAGFISYKKDKYVTLSKHFGWMDEEMTAEQLKHLKNNVKNKSEVYQLSDEMKIVVEKLQNRS